MIRASVVRKSVALFFIAEMLITIIAPSVSMALTAGPTSPEASSFEPVDTTDTVNTLTGDFVYNLPLIEVPGPSGGYPLSLSYHAGIEPELEASWVGLGWTLNPGSITRLTNGIADDISGVNTYQRTFWEGGATETKTYGLSYGIANAFTVSSGLTYANDTYKGRGVGFQQSIGLGFKAGVVNLKLQATYSIAPYTSEPSMQFGLGGGMGIGGGAGVGGFAGISDAGGGAFKPVASGSLFMSNESMAISISANKNSAHIGLSTKNGYGAGVSLSMPNNGQVKTRQKGYDFEIPLVYGFSANLARSYVRYWSDEKEEFSNYGSLFFPSNEAAPNLNTQLYDSYHLESLESLGSGEHPAKYPEGTFADYDSYNVNAQGIGGNIRPYHYNVTAYSQNIVTTANDTNEKHILGYTIPQQNKGVEFRFTSDFSNHIELHDPHDNRPVIELNKVFGNEPPRSDNDEAYDAWRLTTNATNHPADVLPMYFPYSAVGSGEQNTPTLANKVAGSKHIEFFTNQEIVEAEGDNEKLEGLQLRGFIETQSAGFARTHRTRKGKVGAYTITNSSGVNYHFSLPAYSSSERSYSENKDVQNKVSFNDLYQEGSYAYTWFLTGITGPDYVDRGPDGQPDFIMNEYDWGYWVKFDYGRWADQYPWRNPGLGYHEDIDASFKSFSKGYKEVYYLNTIKTKTHTALFVKEIRADGKSAVPRYANSVLTEDKAVTWRDEGNFSPLDVPQPGGFMEFFPVASLGLKSIHLYKNEDLPQTNLNNLSSTYSKSYHYSSVDVTMTPHKGDNILDKFDIENSQLDASKVLRKIEFNYDYTLCKGTPNSYDPEGNLYNCENCENYDPTGNYNEALLGKLTLKSLTFKGKGGNSIIPPMLFNYDVESPQYELMVQSGDIEKMTCMLHSDFDTEGLEVGDIVTFKQSWQTFYGYIEQEIDPNKTFSIKVISPTLPGSGFVTQFTKTKNPPYKSEFYDMWSQYKVDYVKGDGPLFDRFPTEISAKNNDVWSLRSIKTSIGADLNVEYESDTYSKSVYGKNFSLNAMQSLDLTETTPPIPSHVYSGDSPYFLETTLPANATLKLDQLFQVGDAIDIVAAITGQKNGVAGHYIATVGTVQSVQEDKMRFRIYVPFNSAIDFYRGVVRLQGRGKTFGGGTRVKSLEVKDPISGVSTFTDYYYEDESGHSSGVTSYEPIKLQNINVNTSDYPLLGPDFRQHLYQPFLDIIRLSRDIPSPGVMYGKIKIQESVKYPKYEKRSSDTYAVYEFETFDASLIGQDVVENFVDENEGTYDSQEYHRVRGRKIAIKDFTQRIGALKSIKTFGTDGIRLTETINHYLHDEQTDQLYDQNIDEYPDLMTRYNGQGFVQERFNHGRWIKNGPVQEMQALVSLRETYPVIQTGATTINWKTGMKSKIENVSFDFYSGEITKMKTVDGHGNTFMEEIIPAYRGYPTTMGLKVDGGAKKHMLSQQAMSISYKLDPSTQQASGLLGASIQTWSDQVPVTPPNNDYANFGGVQDGIPRMHASYIFLNQSEIPNGDGLFPVTNSMLSDWFTNIVAADQNNSAPPAGWIKTGETTRFNVFSKLLEVTDVYGRKAASLFSLDQRRVFATAVNSGLNDFVFTGAEEISPDLMFAGNIATEGTLTSDETHSGKHSISINSPGAKAFKVHLISSGRSYVAAVWSTDASAKLQFEIESEGVVTVATSEQRKVGNWYLLEAIVPAGVADSEFDVWCTADVAQTKFDDFRVAPLSSAVTGFVYDDDGRLSYLLDNNNLFTHYKYDTEGRLVETIDESFRNQVMKVSENLYHYGRQNSN